jgi:hypothetical protein
MGHGLRFGLDTKCLTTKTRVRFSSSLSSPSFLYIMAPASSNPLDSLPPEMAQIITLAITTFIQREAPAIYIIIVASVWLGIAICLFMTLLYSSTPQSRRKPLFIFCVIAVVFGTIPSIVFIGILVCYCFVCFCS